MGGFGDSMCCSRIRVLGVAAAGIYQKASGWINGRIYWYKIDGDLALWWDITIHKWRIGSSRDLGSNKGYIASNPGSACPTSNSLFGYYDGSLESINTASIQCV